MYAITSALKDKYVKVSIIMLSMFLVACAPSNIVKRECRMVMIGAGMSAVEQGKLGQVMLSGVIGKGRLDQFHVAFLEYDWKNKAWEQTREFISGSSGEKSYYYTNGTIDGMAQIFPEREAVTPGEADLRRQVRRNIGKSMPQSNFRYYTDIWTFWKWWMTREEGKTFNDYWRTDQLSVYDVVSAYRRNGMRIVTDHFVPFYTYNDNILDESPGHWNESAPTLEGFDPESIRIKRSTW